MSYSTTDLTQRAQKLSEKLKDVERREKALQACFKEDAANRVKTLSEIKLRQQTQLLLETTPEERYRRRKENWMAHESSWFRRGLSKYDGQGCNQFKGCIQECRYSAQYGRIEDEEWLRLNEEEAQYRANNTKR
jgi:hypothetical protein